MSDQERQRMDRPATEKPGLKMKDLVEATGVPKSTILYYVQEGMLPEPVKTSPNMAYYDPKCIDAIRFIQEMQRHHRLSIAEIKQVMAARGDDADYTLNVELLNVVFGTVQPEQLLNDQEFCEATGLTTDQVERLVQARLLLPLEEYCFDPEDVVMGRMFEQALSGGIRIEDLTFYVELGEQLVDHEFDLKRKMTYHLPYEADVAISLKMVEKARMSRAYIFDRLFQHRVASLRDLKDDGRRQ